MDKVPFQRQVFILIVIYRWISLIPAITVLLRPEVARDPMFTPWMIFIIVLGVNLALTVFNQSLNRFLIHHPYALLIDMFFIAGVIFASAGINSSYYLYTLSPLMVGAFFFQLRGGLAAAGIFTPMYLAAVYLGFSRFQTEPSIALLSTQLVGIWVIPIVFGYLSLIIHRHSLALDDLHDVQAELQSQNLDLQATHDRLKNIYDMTGMLQAAPDVKSVKRRVLTAITKSFGFSRGVLGLVDADLNTIAEWEIEDEDRIASQQESTKQNSPYSQIDVFPSIALNGNENIFSQALQSSQLFWITAKDLHPISAQLGDWLGDEHAMVIPLIFHEQPIGVLVTPSGAAKRAYSDDQLTTLKILSNQAATALGTTLLCVERAQDLAVEQERNRIARDIHDTVSQSLFGIVFTLDACIQMIPDNYQDVKAELVEVQKLANQTRDQIRHSIFDLWPSSLTMEVFQDDLNHFVKACFSLNPFQVEYDIQGLFENLSPAIRRNLYRVTQEALSNVVHHAGVTSAHVCLEIDEHWVNLMIKDQGRGFDPQAALSRERNREKFGLHGMRERILRLGGSFDIRSEPGHGTQVLIRVPIEQ